MRVVGVLLLLALLCSNAVVEGGVRAISGACVAEAQKVMHCFE